MTATSRRRAAALAASRTARIARYAHARRAGAARLHALTPARFLRRLGFPLPAAPVAMDPPAGWDVDVSDANVDIDIDQVDGIVDRNAAQPFEAPVEAFDAADPLAGASSPGRSADPAAAPSTDVAKPRSSSRPPAATPSHVSAPSRPSVGDTAPESAHVVAAGHPAGDPNRSGPSPVVAAETITVRDERREDVVPAHVEALIENAVENVVEKAVENAIPAAPAQVLRADRSEAVARDLEAPQPRLARSALDLPAAPLTEPPPAPLPMGASDERAHGSTPISSQPGIAPGSPPATFAIAAEMALAPVDAAHVAPQAALGGAPEAATEAARAGERAGAEIVEAGTVEGAAVRPARVATPAVDRVATPMGDSARQAAARPDRVAKSVAPAPSRVEPVAVQAIEDPPVPVRPEALAPRLPRRARIQEIAFDVQAEQARPRASRSVRPSMPAPPAAPAPRQSDALFDQTDGEDRSPAAWLARLTGAMRPAPSAAPPTGEATATATVTSESTTPQAPGTPALPRRAPDAPPGRLPRLAPAIGTRVPARSIRRDTAVPISPAARRFLTPLVGLDPAAVSIVQGPGADAITAAHQADGVTTGETVALASSFQGDSSPEGLGLLAHELTHVLRRAQPRFVPPVARRGHDPVSTSELDEEAVALRVEGHVRQLAEVTPAEGEALAPPSSPDAWHGLPAPWEPLPQDRALGDSDATGIAGVLAPAPTVHPAHVFAPPAAIATAAYHAAPAAGPAFMAAAGLADGPDADAAPVQAAGQGRTPEAPAATGGHAQPAGAAAPPDLDQLARQVYSVLRRRLQADARRECA